MMDYLLDTGLLISNLRRAPGYADLSVLMPSRGHLYISVYTRLEVLRGMRAREREQTMYLLGCFVSLSMDVVIADQSATWLQDWRKRGVVLGEPDVIIAATALQHNLELITTNPRHFPMPELTVWQADEKGNITRWSAAAQGS
jgi:predicted nucleic acid-binding protein